MPEELCYHPEVMELREAIKGLQADFVDTHKALDAAPQEVKCVGGYMGRHGGVATACSHARKMRSRDACRTGKAAASQQLQAAKLHCTDVVVMDFRQQLLRGPATRWHALTAVHVLLYGRTCRSCAVA
jgi:hypothetical protein